MGDNTDTNLLREIDEELRQEHYSLLWARYGNLIIGAAILLVVSVAGYKGWQAYDVSNRSDLAGQFAVAVAAELNGDLSEANQAYNVLAAEAGGGYETLARFRAASTQSQQGDRTGAAAAYSQIADDSGIDQQYRDLAILLGAMNELDTVDPSDIVSLLAPLTRDDGPWRFTARELSALAATRAGNPQQAVEFLNQLIADTVAPAGVRARAQELLAAIGTP